MTLLTPSVTRIAGVQSPAPCERWQALYAADPEAVPYQSPGWTAALCDGGRYVDASRSYELADGRSLVLPLVRRAARPTRLAMAGSLPVALGMGGLVSDHPITVADVRAVLDDLARLPFAVVTVRPNPRAGATWSAAAPGGTIRVARRAHVVALDRPAGDVRAALVSRSIRKSVDKAERNSLSVVWDTTGARLADFEDLYERSVERWAARQHEPLRLARWRMDRVTRTPSLAAVTRHMAGVWRVGVVEIEGRPAAAGIVLIQPGGNANGFRMAMDTELVGRSGAGHLVQVRALEEACRAGCRSFHLGESGQAGGLSDHKERMGGTAFAYEELILERLPLFRLDQTARSVAKRLIGFRDPGAAAGTGPHDQ